MFGPQRNTASVKQTSDIEWIEIKGHTLSLKEKEPMEGIFKEKIVKSRIFTDEKKDVETKFKPARGKNNLTEFTMTIKLKKPIKR